MLPNDAVILGALAAIGLGAYFVWPPLAAAWVASLGTLTAVCARVGTWYLQQPYLGARLSFVDVDDASLASLAPNLYDAATVDLSVVVPAFNEEERIMAMLDDCTAWLQHQPFTWEVIVVDDCSRDATADVVVAYAKQRRGGISLLRLRHNHGKGFAVKQGVYCSRGRYILMADADGATKFADVARLMEELTSSHGSTEGVVCGSRKHLVGSDVVAKRTWARNLLMHVFHFCVDFTFWAANGSVGLEDTQCGFKLFSRGAARSIFRQLHLERWCFDVEVLLIARALGLTVREVPVHWHEVPGSKLKPTGMALMGLELVLLCVLYRCRVWRVRPDSDGS